MITFLLCTNSISNILIRFHMLQQTSASSSAVCIQGLASYGQRRIQYSAEWCGVARFVARIEPARLSPLPLARATFFTQSRFYQSAGYCKCQSRSTFITSEGQKCIAKCYKVTRRRRRRWLVWILFGEKTGEGTSERTSHKMATFDSLHHHQGVRVDIRRPSCSQIIFPSDR